MQKFAWEREPGVSGPGAGHDHQNQRPGFGFVPKTSSQVKSNQATRQVHGFKVPNPESSRKVNVGASQLPTMTKEPGGGSFHWLAKHLGLAKIISGAPPPEYKVDDIKESNLATTSNNMTDRLYCKLCSLKLDNDIAFSNHLTSRIHAEVFVKRITELGFTEFDRKYGSNHFEGKLSEFLEEDDYYIPEEYWNLLTIRHKWKPLVAEYVYRCAALTNLKCKVCFNVQVGNGHDWWKHIVGHRHCQYAVLTAKNHGWLKYVENFGDVPLLDQQAIQDAKKTTKTATSSTPGSFSQQLQPSSSSPEGPKSETENIKVIEEINSEVEGRLGMRVLADAYRSPSSSPVFNQEDEPSIPGWMESMGDCDEDGDTEPSIPPTYNEMSEPSMPSMFDDSEPSIPGMQNEPSFRKEDVIDLTGDVTNDEKGRVHEKGQGRDIHREQNRDRDHNRNRHSEKDRGNERDADKSRDRGRNRDRQSESKNRRTSNKERSNERQRDRVRGELNRRAVDDRNRVGNRDRSKGDDRERSRVNDRRQNKGEVNDWNRCRIVDERMNDRSRDNRKKADEGTSSRSHSRPNDRVENNKNKSVKIQSTPFQCKECKQYFQNAEELILHENKFNYQCSICNIIFPGMIHYKDHIPLNHKSRFESGWLGFSNPPPIRMPTLRKPVCTERKDIPTVPPKEEEKTTSTKGGLKPISFSLSDPGKGKNDQVIGQNMLKEFKEECSEVDEKEKTKYHKCQDCDAVFSTADKLNNHRNKYIYKCLVCETRFTEVDQYCNHIPLKHKARHVKGWDGFNGPSPMKIYNGPKPCEGKGDVNELELEESKKVNSCKNCRATFSNQDDLDRHLNTYEYKCRVCNQIFAKSHMFVQHALTAKSRQDGCFAQYLIPGPEKILSKNLPICIAVLQKDGEKMDTNIQVNKTKPEMKIRGQSRWSDAKPVSQTATIENMIKPSSEITAHSPALPGIPNPLAASVFPTQTSLVHSILPNYGMYTNAVSNMQNRFPAVPQVVHPGAALSHQVELANMKRFVSPGTLSNATPKVIIPNIPVLQQGFPGPALNPVIPGMRNIAPPFALPQLPYNATVGANPRQVQQTPVLPGLPRAPEVKEPSQSMDVQHALESDDILSLLVKALQQCSGPSSFENLRTIANNLNLKLQECVPQELHSLGIFLEANVQPFPSGLQEKRVTNLTSDVLNVMKQLLEELRAHNPDILHLAGIKLKEEIKEDSRDIDMNPDEALAIELLQKLQKENPTMFESVTLAMSWLVIPEERKAALSQPHKSKCVMMAETLCRAVEKVRPSQPDMTIEEIMAYLLIRAIKKDHPGLLQGSDIGTDLLESLEHHEINENIGEHISQIRPVSRSPPPKRRRDERPSSEYWAGPDGNIVCQGDTVKGQNSSKHQAEKCPRPLGVNDKETTDSQQSEVEHMDLPIKSGLRKNLNSPYHNEHTAFEHHRLMLEKEPSHFPSYDELITYLIKVGPEVPQIVKINSVDSKNTETKPSADKNVTISLSCIFKMCKAPAKPVTELLKHIITNHIGLNSVECTYCLRPFASTQMGKLAYLKHIENDHPHYRHQEMEFLRNTSWPAKATRPNKVIKCIPARVGMWARGVIYETMKHVVKHLHLKKMGSLSELPEDVKQILNNDHLEHFVPSSETEAQMKGGSEGNNPLKEQHNENVDVKSSLEGGVTINVPSIMAALQELPQDQVDQLSQLDPAKIQDLLDKQQNKDVDATSSVEGGSGLTIDMPSILAALQELPQEQAELLSMLDPAKIQDLLQKALSGDLDVIEQIGRMFNVQDPSLLADLTQSLTSSPAVGFPGGGNRNYFSETLQHSQARGPGDKRNKYVGRGRRQNKYVRGGRGTGGRGHKRGKFSRWN